jgi:predicted ester cyclase
MRSALPDIHIAVDDVVVDRDRAAASFSVEGSHTREGIGIPPTGRRVRVHGIVIIRAAGGQIAEAWKSWHQLGLLQQLGAVPGEKSTHQFLAAR